MKFQQVHQVVQVRQTRLVSARTFFGTHSPHSINHQDFNCWSGQLHPIVFVVQLLSQHFFKISKGRRVGVRCDEFFAKLQNAQGCLRGQRWCLVLLLLCCCAIAGAIGAIGFIGAVLRSLASFCAFKCSRRRGLRLACCDMNHWGRNLTRGSKKQR